MAEATLAGIADAPGGAAAPSAAAVATPRPADPAAGAWYARRTIAAVPANPAAPADAVPASQPAVFSQQLCEVQLLLDFLSGCPTRRLPDAGAAVAAGLPRDWIEQICRISWPPAGSTTAQADQEALLVKVKDYLNALAAPANGASVAFTLLVAQEDDAIIDDGRETPATAQPGQAFSRTSLAGIAFPGLVGKSRGFRTGILSIGIGLAIWLLLTCGLSFYAALGNARLAQLSAATAALDVARGKLAGPAVVTFTAAAAPDTTAAAAVAPVPHALPCDHGPATTAVEAAACADIASAAANVAAAQGDVQAWWRFGGHGAPATAVADATAALGVLGTGVLPVFYGILGAAAAVVRLLSGRMRLSLLMPRDLTLALQQLALGAVVGACIGLFVTPGAGSGDGVLGTVSLSSSALSFVAGFGVDAVFATLEGLIARLFNTAPPAPPTPAVDAKS